MNRPQIRLSGYSLAAAFLMASVSACAADWRSAPIYPALKMHPVAAQQKVGKPCLPPPPAVRNISTVSKYGEGNETNSSVVDEDSEKQYLADTAPIVAFASEVASRSDHFVEGRGTGNFDAVCALDWLNAWAESGAFLGDINRQGEAVRKWELGTFSTVYIKIADAPFLDKGKLERVQSWIHDIALAVKADYSRDLHRSSRQNNHMNWAAWSVLAAGVATNDREMFDWGIDGYRKAIDQIQEDGSLPLELERRSRAASYHMFALQPLVMIAEAGEANGIAMWRMKDNRLQRLIDLNIAAVADREIIGRMNGFKQDPNFSESSLSWVEAYFARSQDARVLPLINKYRPFGARRTGGDMTALFVTARKPDSVVR